MVNSKSLLSEHDSYKLFKANMLITVEVCDGDHLLDVLLGEVAAQTI